MGIEFRGIPELQEGLKKRATLDKVKKVVQFHGNELQNRTQRKMEGAYTKGYSHGATKRSVPGSSGFRDGGLTAYVSAGTDYFPYVEHGTRFMNAEPALQPAFNEQVTQFEQDLRRLVK